MKFIKNVFYLFFPIISGSLIALIVGNFDYYLILDKPPLSPPKIIFPIVWSIIYILMGIAYFLYKKKTDNKNYLYYIQLIVNLLWTIIFFILQSNLLSTIWILLLDLLIILNIIKFYKYNKVSTYLFIPYLIWSLFATYLTIGILFLN